MDVIVLPSDAETKQFRRMRSRSSYDDRTTFSAHEHGDGSLNASTTSPPVNIPLLYVNVKKPTYVMTSVANQKIPTTMSL